MAPIKVIKVEKEFFENKDFNRLNALEKGTHLFAYPKEGDFMTARCELIRQENKDNFNLMMESPTDIKKFLKNLKYERIERMHELDEKGIPFKMENYGVLVNEELMEKYPELTNISYLELSNVNVIPSNELITPKIGDYIMESGMIISKEKLKDSEIVPVLPQDMVGFKIIALQKREEELEQILPANLEEGFNKAMVMISIDQIRRGAMVNNIDKSDKFKNK